MLDGVYCKIPSSFFLHRLITVSRSVIPCTAEEPIMGRKLAGVALLVGLRVTTCGTDKVSGTSKPLYTSTSYDKAKKPTQ